jgi:hypothetical protein
MHTIYVAGRVLRSDFFPSPSGAILRDLYAHLRSVGEQTDTQLQLPIYRKELDDLPALEFAQAILSQIMNADSMLALIDAPGSHAGSNISVAGEAHWAAGAGKSVAIVAEDPDRVPRLLRALSPFEIRGLYKANFQEVFRELRNAPSRSQM